MFIILESTEGAGKGTLVNYLHALRQELGKGWVFTREPGGTYTAEKIRELLLSAEVDFQCEDEILLLAIARHNHLVNVIRPALEAGLVVFCERWVPTTIAYQVYGRTYDQPESQRQDLMQRYASVLEYVNNLYGINQQEVDLAILMDIDPAIGLKRIASRGTLDRIEKEGLGFFNAVREGYHQVLLKGEGFRVKNTRLIHAEKTIEEVRCDVLEILKSFNLL